MSSMPWVLRVLGQRLNRSAAVVVEGRQTVTSLLSSAKYLMQESKRSMTEPPPRGQPPPAGDIRHAPASTKGTAAVARPGLQNEAGEYNCFLNVIIQCLWHCSAFRARLLSCPPHYEHGDRPSLCPACRPTALLRMVLKCLSTVRCNLCSECGLSSCSIMCRAS